jgi:hypothetical protein
MRLGLFALLITTSSPVAARGVDGWGWLIVGAPFAFALFLFFDAFSDKKRRRSNPYAGLPAFLLSLLLGIPIAVFCAEWLSGLIGLSEQGGFWLLLGIEFVTLLAYDRLVGLPEASARSSPEKSSDDKR